ncbi:hypothetical protein AGR7B_Lc60005 [Agrobacterium deltaense RV3]|nr:hypothetical protein AGR7B_Lc60005 [Agrobacterium deltaense RV3]
MFRYQRSWMESNRRPQWALWQWPTERRTARVNDASEWVLTAVPEMRIVSDDLWQRGEGASERDRRAVRFRAEQPAKCNAPPWIPAQSPPRMHGMWRPLRH